MSEASESHSINGLADLLFSGGPILTMDANRPGAEAVAVRDGRILAVGSMGELSSLIGAGTEKIDLEGRALLPGLIDPHMHSSTVQLADWTAVSPMTRATADDVSTALREAVPASTGWMLAQQFDPSITGDDLAGRIRDLLWHAASQGVTLLHDCGNGSIDGTSDLDVLRTALDAASPVRYRGMLVSSCYDDWMAKGVRPGDGDDLFRVEGIKAWSDGSNQAGTGFQREPYLGQTSRGALNYSPEEPEAVVARAHRDGWQVGVHANGDAAIDAALDAFERALASDPRADHRHRMEHCSVTRPEHIARMAASGISPSFLIGHVRWWGKAFRDRLLGPERTAFYDPCASALAGGLRISLHSDWNVTPLQPLRYVQDAATRIMAEGGEVLNPGERSSVEAALRAVTIDAAWQCRADEVTGSIEIGKYADLVLLEEEPTAVDPITIQDTAVSQTRLGGAVRFE